MDKIYDVIILGAGPGGLAAGIYAATATSCLRMIGSARR